MEEGFIPDMSHAQVLQLKWQRGAPEASKFLGMTNGVKLHPEQTVKVTACRCTDCGFLKLYARENAEDG
jgi:hypothetical protein